MRFFILWVMFLLPSLVFGQVDTIKTPVYTSVYNHAYKCPVMVIYKLYKGGGDCARSSFRFSGDEGTASNSDYAKSGYDAGHLCPAEDFAYDCSLEKVTFSFYNCAPQTANLNRGLWKSTETYVRKLSQTDSLLVISGCIFGKDLKRKNNMVVPLYYWKIVQSMTTKEIVVCQMFTNRDKDCFRKTLPITHPFFKNAKQYLLK